MKNLLLILFGLLLLGCNKKSNSVDLSRQKEFVQAQIIGKTHDLNTRVKETGYSLVGREFVKIGEQLNIQTQNLISEIERDQMPSKNAVLDLIAMANNKYDTIAIDSSFITQAYDEFKQTGRKESFILSLLLFNSDFISSIHNQFGSYFQQVDYFEPIAVGDNFSIKKGETFKGKAISQAKMVAVKFLYEIDDPQNDEGFVELPSNVNSKSDGIINIIGKKVGTHKIKLRSTYWQNGKKVSFENEFELEVKE
ncbi:hypothetical protein [Fulvivirga ligni]|uniref:hypothetical protein n=1 Tax=Fulvivirga ligni TaxID=2904246 RepID=UPI001F17ABB0|nr:hypothetical protein [Fulvivirga ligni]UII20530.1 hypothetical protein LVD16_22070 [Fulvivirga ligni]